MLEFVISSKYDTNLKWFVPFPFKILTLPILFGESSHPDFDRSCTLVRNSGPIQFPSIEIEFIHSNRDGWAQRLFSLWTPGIWGVFQVTHWYKTCIYKALAINESCDAANVVSGPISFQYPINTYFNKKKKTVCFVTMFYVFF